MNASGFGLKKLQHERCEFSDQPLNRNHPICGKLATHSIIDMFAFTKQPFPLCKDHWDVMLADIAVGEQDVLAQ